MKRVYFHYSLWEDYKQGMYSGYKKEQEEELINKAIELLTDNKEFYETMIKINKEWIYSFKMQLSNKTINRQAWLGQASCCYKYGVPEDLTRFAWRRLSEEQQIIANETADLIINRFDKNIHWSQKCLKEY